MSHHDHSGHHQSQAGFYLKILIGLMILTVATVAVSRFDFGSMNMVVAMVVASIKAGLVALFFMHLKYEDKITWLYAAFPIFLLFLLIAGNMMDVMTR